MTRSRIAVAGAILVLVFLVSTLPARVVAGFLPRGLAIEGVGGTVWRGSAARASVMLDGGRLFNLGRVDWQLSPLSLLLLSPGGEFNSQWGAQRISGKATVSPGGSVTLEDLRANLDIEFVRQLAPLYVGGRLQADFSVLELDGNTPKDVEGRLVWQDAVWTARTGDVALGTYAAEVAGAEGNLTGTIMTLSGPLTVIGDTTLQGRDYSVDIDLSGPALENQGLRQSLQLLAAPTATGFDMVLQGTL